MGRVFLRKFDQVNNKKAQFRHKILTPHFTLQNYAYLILHLILLNVISCVMSKTEYSFNKTLDCSTEFILTSPHYPGLYDNGASEEWYITAPSHRRILITFNDFNLEADYDAILIKDKVNSLHRKRYTGENMHFSPFLSQGYIVIIQFTTSKDSRRRGFNISFTCYDTSPTMAAISMDGYSPTEGFLELSSQSGEWKRVCEESLSSNVANIICTELGYPGVTWISYHNDTCLLNQNCVKARTCQNDAFRVIDCEAAHSVCSTNTSVKIKCNEVGYAGCRDFKSKPLTNGFPFITKEQCISSCRQDDIESIAIMNYSECFCSTSNEIKDISKVDDTLCTLQPASTYQMSVYSASVGFCDELNDTVGGSWDSNITWFGSIVHLTCMDGYNLSGNGTLQCVPGSTPYYPVWNDSSPSCVMEAATTIDNPETTTMSGTDMTADLSTGLETSASTSKNTAVTTGEKGIMLLRELFGLYFAENIIPVLRCKVEYHKRKEDHNKSFPLNMTLD